MHTSSARLFDDTARGVGAKIGGLFALLIVANVAAWAWTWAARSEKSVLLGTALLAWVFGLRHAVDADHIAAIDNVVRKLMQERKRPLTVGFFFSLGHSTVVMLTTRADPTAARLASLELAASMFHGTPNLPPPESHSHCAPQSETACCPPSR